MPDKYTRLDFQSGAIAAAIAASGTTIDFTGDVPDFPTITLADPPIPITLDPGGANEEKVLLTVYTAAANTGTITATVNAHGIGTAWEHAAYADDFDGLQRQLDSLIIPSGSPHGAHLYWRVNVTANQGSPNVAIGELEFAAVPEGADQATGGTAAASSTLGGFPASNGFNNDAGNTFWVSNGAAPQWLRYQFAAPVEVSQLKMTSRNDGFQNDTPKDFQIQYSDDGSVWTTAWSVSGQTSWAANQTRTFIDPAYSSGVTGIVHIQDRKASGTAGGSSTAATWQTRVLNTVVYDPAGIVVSLSSNQITLPAGTYEVHAWAVGYHSGNHMTRIRNVTDSVTLAIGSANRDVNTDEDSHPAPVRGIFILPSNKAIELQHWMSQAFATMGLGVAVTTGESEVYADVFIRKIA